MSLAQPPPFPGASPPPTPAPSRRTSAKSNFKNTLASLEKAVDRLPIIGLKAAASSALEIIKITSKARQSTEHLDKLAIHLRFLENELIIPLLGQHSEILHETKARVDHLVGELDQLAKDWQKLKTARRIWASRLYSEDYGVALADISRRIKVLVDEYLLDCLATGSSVERAAERVEVSQAIGALPYAEAGFDSMSQNNASKCFKGTRVCVLKDILDWVTNGHHCIYILNGIAGVGKTTIAQTIATFAASQKWLSASFFFSRYDSKNHRNSSRRFFSTLAFQLACFREEFAEQISKALAQSPGAPRKKVAEQMKKLILEPLQGVAIRDGRPILIVLDALDECAEAEGAEVLQLLVDAMPRLPPNFKLFITLRPEHQFRSTLDLPRNHDQLILHDIDETIVSEDIRSYLHHQLSREEVQKVILSSEWQIAPRDLDALVQAAGRLFIVASTAAKFIKDGNIRNPARQLDVILRNSHINENSPQSPFAALDRLYSQILEAAIPLISNQQDNHIRRRFHNVVGTVIVLQASLPPQSLARLVSEDPADVNAVLDLLQSIIVPSGEDRCPSVYHPSFPDFLTTPTRCTNEKYRISAEEHHTKLAGQCLDVMDRLLKKNICCLPIPDRYMRNHEIPELTVKLKEHIPAELEYACTYWAVHLSKATASEELVQKVDVFASKHLLFWLEVLSFVGHLEHAYPALIDAQRFSTSNHGPVELSTMLSDAQRFLMGSYETIKVSALHVYYSALPFAPRESILYQMYEHEGSESIEVLRGGEISWNPLLAVLVGHSDRVTSVVFSSDGTRLTSTSNDNTVRLWNGVTGAIVAELGYLGSAGSVLFSPNGTRLASASYNTIQLWNAVTGLEVTGLEVHSGSVKCVAFSPDGARFAFTSHKSVQLWNGVTGVEVSELKGHTDWVSSVAFSSDGTHLASTSYKTVRLWNGETGAVIAVLQGHSDWINSVVFSPYGNRLASASNDRTVRLWNGVTGAGVAELKGHPDCVSSIAFSPDGTRLASASCKMTILWNGVTGDEVARLKDRSIKISSLVFSPDGTRLASVSNNKMARLWNAVTGVEVAELKGHSDEVNTAIFSPDSARLASISNGNTVRLWNGMTGAEIAEIEGHSDKINSVVFSPDGSHLASASNDRTIRLWNGVTGVEVVVLDGHSDWVNSAVFSPDGTRLASVSNDNTIRLWNTVNEVDVARQKDHSNEIDSVVFSSDGKYLASVSFNTVRLWDGVTGIEVAKLQGNSTKIISTTFSPGGNRLISVSNTIVRLWNVVTGAEVAELEVYPDWIESLVFSPDGIRLAFISYKTARLWSGVTGAEVVELGGHSDWISSVVFSPDGTRLASTSYKTVRLWNGETGAVVAVLQGHSDWINSVGFSPDGTRFASASYSTIRLWDSVTGEFIEEIQGSSSNEIAYAFQVDCTSKSRNNILGGIVNKSATLHPSISVNSLLLMFDEKAKNYVLSGQWGKTGQTVSLCRFPSALPRWRHTSVGTSIALGLEDGRVFIFSAARLKLV